MTENVLDQDTLTALRDMTGQEFVVELIEAYVDESPALIRDMNAALEKGDAESFRRAAHSLKSSSASLGALAFSDFAREMEMKGRGGDLEGAASQMARFQEAYDLVEAALKDLADGA